MSRQGMMWLQRLVVTIGVLLSLAACGGSGEVNDTAASSGSAGVGASTTAATSPPTDATSAQAATTVPSEDSDEAREFLFLAQEQLVASCMSDRGFSYVSASLPTDEARPSTRSGWATDVERARAQGYGFDAITAQDEGAVSESGDDPSSAVDPNAAYLATLSNAEVSAWLEALDGAGETTVEEEGEAGEVVEVPTDGCVPQVEAAIYGDLGEWDAAQAVFEAIEREAFDRLESDERMVSARQLWTECMEGRGYAYSDPEEPQTEALQGYVDGGDRAVAQAREIEIATADAECVAESEVAVTYDALLGMFRSEAEASREADLVAVRELEAAAVERAKEFVGGS